MKLVKFVGRMGIPSKSARHLDQDTLERLKVEVPETLLVDGALIFGPETDHTVEMSNEASESLVAALPTEFVIVDEEGNVDSQLELLLTNDEPENPQAPENKSKKDKKKESGESSDN